MSNADSEEVSVVVERGGITVEKSFEPDDFPVPAIAFVIHSDREEATNVRIVDDVPDDVPAQDIGFHPKYGADFWRVEDEQIVFEREFEAGEEYTTVYGLRAKDTDDIERFLTEPAIEGVEGEESVSDIIGDEDEESEAAEDDADEAPADEEPDTSIDLDDPLDGDTEAAEAEDDDTDTDAPSPAEASADDLESAIANVDEADTEAEDEETDGESEAAVDESTAAHAAEAEHGNGTAEAVAVDDIAAALAAEIRAGDVADEDLQTLNEALGPDIEAMSAEAELPGHVEAKLDKLQSDVDEVVAYTGALEEFLDDAGTADDLLAMRERFDDVEGSLERLEGTVSAVESDVTAVDDRVDSIDDRVDSMAETTESLDGRISTIEDDLATLRNDLETMQDELGEDLSDRLADVEAELEEMEDDIETLDNLRQALAGN
jgi:DNA repair exonuclease SbcCD ATPase subunit